MRSDWEGQEEEEEDGGGWTGPPLRRRRRAPSARALRRVPVAAARFRYDARAEAALAAALPFDVGVDVGTRRLGFACEDRRDGAVRLESHDLLAAWDCESHRWLVRDWSRDDCVRYAREFADAHALFLRKARFVLVEHQMRGAFHALATALRAVLEERCAANGTRVLDVHAGSVRAKFCAPPRRGLCAAERYRRNKAASLVLARRWLGERQLAAVRAAFAEADGDHPDALEALMLIKYAQEHTQHMLRLAHRPRVLRLPGPSQKRPGPPRVLDAWLRR